MLDSQSVSSQGCAADSTVVDCQPKQECNQLQTTLNLKTKTPNAELLEKGTDHCAGNNTPTLQQEEDNQIQLKTKMPNAEPLEKRD